MTVISATVESSRYLQVFKESTVWTLLSRFLLNKDSI